MTPPPSSGSSAVLLLACLVGSLTSACGESQAPGVALRPSSAESPKSAEPLWIGSARPFAREVTATAADAGGLWSAFLSSEGAKNDEVRSVDLVLHHLDSTGNRKKLVITTGGSLAAPTLATFEGGVLIVWESVEDGIPSLQCATAQLTAAGKLEAHRTSPPPSNSSARLPRLTSLPNGGAALVWQAIGESDLYDYDIFLSRFVPGADTWSPPLPLTNNESDDWCPQIVATGPDSNPTIHVVFDRFTAGSPNGFDVVYLAVDSRGGALRETLVATGPNYQGHPSLAADPWQPTGAVWVAYEEAPQFGEFDSLRSRRSTRLAMVTPSENNVRVAHAELPAEVTSMQRGDFPQVAIGASGLVLSRRVPNTDYQARNAARNSFYANWRTRITTFGEDGEGFDFEVPESDGDNYNDAVLIADSGSETGTRFVFATDTRSSSFESSWSFSSTIEGLWRIGISSIASSTANSRGFPLVQDGPPTPVLTTQSAGPMGLTWSARPDDIFWGDLHRHTHQSRCAGGQDGTFLDAVRYARGPGALDFLAITDHYQHLTPAAWWRSRRDADRWNAEGSLVVFPGLERAVPKEGHQNLIWPTGKLAIDASRTALPGVFPQDEVISIPHMSSLSDNAFSWEAFDPERHRLVEIHQGRRGSYEAANLPHAALDIGAQAGRVSRLPEVLALTPHAKLPGLISSADHSSSSNGYAGVYLPAQTFGVHFPTRKKVFAALGDARTVATTGPRPGHQSGPKRVHLENGASVLKVLASARELAYIELVRNGELVARLDAKGHPADDAKSADSRVMVNLHLWNRTENELIIRARNLGEPDEQDPIRFSQIQLRRSLGNGLAYKSINPHTIKVTIQPGVRADAELTLDIHAPSGSLLDFIYRDNGVSWNSDLAITGQSLRIPLESTPSRPLVDVTRLTFGSPSPTLDEGLFESTFDVPEGDSDAVYYARAVWRDGNMAWSSMRRGAKPDGR